MSEESIEDSIAHLLMKANVFDFHLIHYLPMFPSLVGNCNSQHA